MEDTDDETKNYLSQEKFLDLIVHYIMTQYGIGEGLRKFKKQGERAARKESHIHGMIDRGRKKKSNSSAYVPHRKETWNSQGKRMHKQF